MSFLYKNGKYTTTRDFFVGKKTYKENAFLEGVDLLDTYYQYPNYGLLNANFEPVVLNTDENDSGLLPLTPGSSTDIKAASFVAQAFSEFRTFYLQKIEENRLSMPPFLENLVPKSAYTSFDREYNNYLSSVISEFASLVANRVDPEQPQSRFKEALLSIIKKNIGKYPVSRSGYVLSDKCPISVSGLAIELANLPYEEDTSKGRMYDSKEFQCYGEVASLYGFYVDKNAPWRLIANLESPIMKTYISRLRPGTKTETILGKVFRSKTQYEDISSVFYVMSTVYIEYLKLFSQRPARLRIDDKELISTTLEIRMAETSIPADQFEDLSSKVIFLEQNYAARYPNTPYYQAAGKIGKICSQKLKEIYLAKSKINSYNKTTLKEYN